MLKINLPYLLKPLNTFHNPIVFPDRCDFTLDFCPITERYFQVSSPEINELNKQAYLIGSLLGTAMDDTLLGASYAHDFFNFIKTQVDIKKKKILEIGCGRGALLALLSKECLQADGIEPGAQNKKHWKKFNVNVLPETFPSDKLNEKYDIIIGFLLLEHLENLDTFFYNLRKILASDGDVIFAVPDCSEHIKTGDISMLIHQHYHYFTSKSLENTLNAYGFNVKNIQNSNTGGIIYVSAENNNQITTQEHTKNIYHDNINDFSKKSNLFQSKINTLIMQNPDLGIYCPARIINLLPPEHHLTLSFFDDDKDLHNKYYPGFNIRIENFDDLLRKKPHKVFIASRSFSKIISDKLIQLSNIRAEDIISISDL